MLLSLNILNTFLDKKIKDFRALCDFLTSIGIEVENIDNQKEKLSNIIVGRILEKSKHINADKLSVLTVDTGSSVLKIVCGANNQKEGDKVVVALEGAKLPNGMIIKKSNIRGVESNGMCCSYEELGMQSEADGIIILDEKTQIGKNIYEVFGLDDVLFEIAVYPNRGDLLSHYGVSREAKLFNNSNLVFNPEIVNKTTEDQSLKIIVQDSNCYKYYGRKFNGVKVKKTPDWLKASLEKLGLRSINNLVDISNFVMHYLGQPLHIFDADKIKNNTIIVRKAIKGECIKLLDEKNLVLNQDDILITSEDKILALAGIMGGFDSGVSTSTKNIILECAGFNSSKIRTTARFHNLSTDSSYRFERNIDHNNFDKVIDYASALIKELSEPESIEEIIKFEKLDNNITEIEFSINNMNSMLGVNIAYELIIKILNDLDFKVKKIDSDLLKVNPPSYRNDIKIKEDVYEEVLRIYGYNKVEVSYPSFNINYDKICDFSLESNIKNLMKNLAYNEVVNYSFLSSSSIVKKEADLISLINPISEEMKYLRPNLLSSLLNNIKYNFNHRNSDLKLFELANVYLPNKNYEPNNKIKLDDIIVYEQSYLAGIVSGRSFDKETWINSKEKYNFYDMKGELSFLLDSLNISSYNFKPASHDFFHPNICLSIQLSGLEAGFFGQLNPILLNDYDINTKLFYFEIEASKLLKNIKFKTKYKDFSKFPSIRRDISFLIDANISYSDIDKAVAILNIKDLSSYFVFDIYKGTNIPLSKQSMAIAFIFSNNNRTLTDKEVDILLKELINSLILNFSIEIR